MKDEAVTLQECYIPPSRCVEKDVTISVRTVRVVTLRNSSYLITNRPHSRQIVWTSKRPYLIPGLRSGQMKRPDPDLGGVLSGPRNGLFA